MFRNEASEGMENQGMHERREEGMVRWMRIRPEGLRKVEGKNEQGTAKNE